MTERKPTLRKYRVTYIEEVLHEVTVEAMTRFAATRQIKEMVRPAGVVNRRIRYVVVES